MSALLPFDSKTIAFSSGHFIETSLIKSKSILTGGLIALMISACGSGGSDQEEDPLVADEPVAYVKRAVPVDEDGDVITEDIMDPTAFNGGAALYIRDRASQSANERNITASAFPAGALYDIKDVDVSYDGRRLVFAMRDPELEDVDEEDQPKWNLWEYDLDNDSLTPVIADAIRSGEHHDISPAYLPDGRIVFTSTRQVRSRAILLDEGKSGYAATTDDEDIFNLHIVDPSNDPNGANIQQVTFSQGHDLQPTVLSDGRIAFLRSDMGDQRDRLAIYTLNIDGSNLRILYGYHSQTTGNTSNNQTTFIDLQEMSDGSLSAILQQRESETLGGDIVRIDSEGFTDINQASYNNSGATGPGQNSVTQGTVNLDDNISTHGYFNSAFPIDGSLRFLVSWNPCRLLDDNDTPDDTSDDIILACTDSNLANPELEAAPAFFGLWLYDANGGTQNPVAIAQENEMYTDVVLMKERTLPTTVTEATLDEDLVARTSGVLNIRSVYDTDGTDTSAAGISVLSDPAQTLATARPARFLRLIKPVSIPSDDVYDFDNSAFGLNQNRGMREILGYAPIEPDGSVMVEAPADVAFHFDVVDVNGERIAPLHRNNLQLKSGETYQCVGCHTADSEEPHGRLNQDSDARSLSVNPGALAVGVHFNNTKYSNVSGVEDRDTMAEVFAKAIPTGETEPNGPRVLSTDLEYTDDWSDPVVNADFNLRYAGTSGDVDFTPLLTTAPTDAGCQTTWQANCRTVINYPDHIQPIWEATRVTNSCVTCHSVTDSVGGAQQPAGQLELTSQASTDEVNHYTSYRELLRQDTPLILNPAGSPTFLTLFVLEIVNGVQQFYLDADGDQILDVGGNPIPEVRLFSEGDDDVDDIYIQSFTGAVGDVYLDAMGAPILDAGGSPIDVMIPIDPNDIPASPVMRLSNASGSRFFDKLEGSDGTVDHSSFMSPNELRLLREWLDIGGQYYNNPLDAPLD
ncbi:MAG: hypothetical protein ACRBBR_05110 [Cellvibrionaceae bacterium]